MAKLNTFNEIKIKLTRAFSHNPTEVEVHKQRDLCRVKRENGGYGGYKKDILTENLSCKDNELLVCKNCKGIMREACLSRNQKSFCYCCVRNTTKPNPEVYVRRRIHSLKCSCPLIERGCEWLGTLKDCENHLETCGYVGDRCKLGCGIVLLRNKLKVHEREKCQQRKIECELCIKNFKICDILEHIKQCQKMEILCHPKCGKIICRENMAQHLKQECGLTLMTCKQGCGIMKTRNELKLHMNSCSHRKVTCEHCTKHFKLYDMPKHFKQCPKMKLSCEICGETMCRGDMTQHLEQDCVEREIECPVAKYKCEVPSMKRKHLSQHLEENRTKHIELQVNAIKSIAVKHCKEVNQHREEIKIYREEANQHRKQIQHYKELVQEQRKEIEFYSKKEVNQHREEIKTYREELNQHRKQIQRHKELIQEQREEIEFYVDEDKTNRGQVEKLKEENNQRTKVMNNQRIRINRMAENINLLCSFGKITKLDWEIENLSKFIQINHISEERNVAGHDLNIFFLKESIYVGYASTHGYYDNISAKYRIRLYSTVKNEAVKEYDYGSVNVYTWIYPEEDGKSLIGRIPQADVEELSLIGCANKLILEMYITEL